MIHRVHKLTQRIGMSVLGQKFTFRVLTDQEYPESLRVFIQVVYTSPCTKTNEMEEWRGRKWYLSKHMTDDEIIKTCWAAFEAAVKHELLEGFKVDGVTLFNPHIDFEELLKISHKEITRT